MKMGKNPFRFAKPKKKFGAPRLRGPSQAVGVTPISTPGACLAARSKGISANPGPISQSVAKRVRIVHNWLSPGKNRIRIPTSREDDMNPSRPNRRDFLRTLGAGIAAVGISNEKTSGDPAGPASPKGAYVGGLTTPRLDRVRVGFIGVGARGGGHVRRMLLLDGVDITAICDPHEPSARRWETAAREAGHETVKVYCDGNYDYRTMLENENLDIVLISTPWRWHAPQAIDSMLAGCHAFIEVPIAQSVEECWKIVDTAEATQRHCMMMENVCYGRDELMVLNMCRQGLFGDLLHGEAAYIHDLRGQMKQISRGTGSWRTNHHTRRDGNLYPTHGLGPVAQYMNIDRGSDRFQSLVSMSSPARGRQLYAEENFDKDHLRNKARYVCGDMNTSLIKTAQGRSILVQHDTTSPRPYTRHNYIQGTRGAFGGFPNRIHVEGRSPAHGWQQGDDLAPFYEEFDHPLWKKIGEIAKKAGGHGGMDFVMSWRMIYCLRNGQPLDQNVYEGCSWSVISPLSEESVRKGSAPIEIPDFTRGRWKSTAPLEVVT